MRRFQAALPVLRTAVRSMSEDRVPMMGAALAYYTVFSIAPLLVISMGLAGIFFGERGGAEILDAVGGVVGEEGARAVRAMLEGAASRPRAGLAATVIGVVTMLVGASGVFGQLEKALHVIWKVAPEPSAPWTAGLKRRLLSFGMVGVIALLLLAMVIGTAALSAAGRLLGDALPGGAAPWQAINALISLSVVTVLIALVFKVLSGARLPWRDAVRGGFWTSALFTLGQFALGFYLGRAGAASAYGAAGSLVALLVWVYYSAQILLFGAELTRAYALHRRGEPRPAFRRAHTGRKP